LLETSCGYQCSWLDREWVKLLAPSTSLLHELHKTITIVLQAMGMKGSVSTLLDEADTDGDGRLSLPEFQKLLHRASFGSHTRRDHYHHHR
jgi:hypothetical protein